MQRSGTTAFLISKPLQLMIALLILRQLRLDRKPVFVITNSFHGAGGVAERLAQAFLDQLDVHFFETPADAYSHLGANRFDHVFIDSDVGLRKSITLARLKLRSRRTHINVFEEGLGTYRNDLYRGPEARVFAALGIATRFGASPLVERIFVLDSDEYRGKFPDLAVKVIVVSSSMSVFLSEEYKSLKNIFSFAGISPPDRGQSEICNLYLTNWTVDDAFLARFMSFPGDLFIKAHPHIWRDFQREGIEHIDAGVPAELVIAELLANYDKVQIYDHMSSTRRYATSRRVTFQCVDTST